MSTRANFYARLGIARRALIDDHGWDEDRYRAHLAAHGAGDHKGRPSASTLSGPQLDAALAELEAIAGRQHGEGSILARCHRGRRGQWGKVIALWCALADAEVVRDRSEAAMLAWAKRHIRAARVEWAGGRDLHRCIEALKSWAAREGVPLTAPED
jgi:hypothetical protein